MERSSRWQSRHRGSEYKRLRQKTLEEAFTDRLSREFEFSPCVRRGVLDVVGEMFFDNRELGAGQIDYTCVSAEEGPGKEMGELKKIRVRLSREVPSDLEIQRLQGSRARRRAQLLRMSEEAFDQGGLLTQEDLGRIIGVSSRTIRRDVELLMRQKLKLYLRGLQQDIGKGISHKRWIVGLYLEWKTYSEIERITGHSVGAIKRYLSDFTRVLMAHTRGIRSAREIGYYIGRTARMVQEYLELIKQAQGQPQQRRRLESLKTQQRHLERQMPVKKGVFGMVWRPL